MRWRLRGRLVGSTARTRVAPWHRSLFVKISRDDMKEIVRIPEVRAALEVFDARRASFAPPDRTRGRARPRRSQVVQRTYKVDLKSVLLIPTARARFGEFLRSEYAAENLEVRCADVLLVPAVGR